MKRQPQFFAEYIQLYRPLLNRLNTLLAPYGLFNSQWGILKLLKLEGEMTSAEIASRRQVEKPSVTKIIQRLLEMNLVSIRPGTDRREKWIGLTELGHETVDKVVLQLETLYCELLEGVELEDIETAIRVMESARKNLNK
ncbi:MarR family transcriptional regulator [Sporosarcina sp. GW1-11]|uniref:MarR family winged helix-turn-helix transcriptional regulator n=1 Tax=Sporosarcina sp. GW1-11 TaxID=2899126 RepID=UPI00294DB418|nr:MarR family transcriptional regulator [Sporosarcina sp. GW1-11]MDV6377265.1 MarR family transcriptional regulator [Sporosarcina sp. GW1-11]